MFAGEKVLVTGGAGFIGSHVVRRLLDLGAQVTATVHEKQGGIEHARLRYVTADLRRAEDCRRAAGGVDYVFMCAANTSGAAVMEKTPLVHLTPNVVMNLQMLEAAYEAGVKKFLFISSNTVYPVTDHPVKEDEVTGEFFHKYHTVAWMKRFTEIVCEIYAKRIPRPMPTVVVRPANVYGENDDFEWETSHVIPALIRRVVERHDPFVVWGDGKDLKEFIYVGDLVEGMIAAMEKLDAFEPINIAVGKPCTVRQVLDVLLRIDGFGNANVSYDASKPTMIPKRLIDVELARKRLGFEAKTSMEEGLRRTVAWYRAARAQKSPQAA
jgi:GDP-L-fucose synthase